MDGDLCTDDGEFLLISGEDHLLDEEKLKTDTVNLKSAGTCGTEVIQKLAQGSEENPEVDEFKRLNDQIQRLTSAQSELGHEMQQKLILSEEAKNAAIKEAADQHAKELNLLQQGNERLRQQLNIIKTENSISGNKANQQLQLALAEVQQLKLEVDRQRIIIIGKNDLLADSNRKIEESREFAAGEIDQVHKEKSAVIVSLQQQVNKLQQEKDAATEEASNSYVKISGLSAQIEAKRLQHQVSETILNASVNPTVLFVILSVGCLLGHCEAPRRRARYDGGRSQLHSCYLAQFIACCR